jgi:hypothetical protein
MKRVIIAISIFISGTGMLQAGGIYVRKPCRHKNYWKHIAHKKNGWQRDADRIKSEPE